MQQHQQSLQARTVGTVIASTYPHYQPAANLQTASPLQHQQPQQFVAAIPVQPTMIAAPFPTPTVISTMAPPEVNLDENTTTVFDNMNNLVCTK
jgi:hypothetical protein